MLFRDEVAEKFCKKPNKFSPIPFWSASKIPTKITSKYGEALIFFLFGFDLVFRQKLRQSTVKYFFPNLCQFLHQILLEAVFTAAHLLKGWAPLL